MKFKDFLIEQSNNKKQPTDRQSIRKAIQQGQVDSVVGAIISDDVRKIIRRHVKGEADWKVSHWKSDIGITYYGDDLQYASAVVDGIIGDIYGYFHNGPKDQLARVVKYQKQVNDQNRTYYKVVPRKGQTQIQFFRANNFKEGEPVMGVLIL